MFSRIVSPVKAIYNSCRSYPTLTQGQGQASLRSVLRTLELATELGKQATMNKWILVRGNLTKILGGVR